MSAPQLGDTTTNIDSVEKIAVIVEKRLETDPKFLIEEVPYEEASRYGVCDTNNLDEITEAVEKSEDLPTNLVMTRFYTFSPEIFHAFHLVQPSNRGEYEISEAIDLLIRSGRTIDAIGLESWRINVGYPEDCDEAERRLQEEIKVEAEVD